MNSKKDWYHRGIALSDLGKLDEAIAAYQKHLEINPGHRAAVFALCLALSDLDRVGEAQYMGG